MLPKPDNHGRRVTPLCTGTNPYVERMAEQIRGVNFRMTAARLADLRARSSELGISVQAYLELQLFGEISQRKVNRRDSHINEQEELPLRTA